MAHGGSRTEISSFRDKNHHQYNLRTNLSCKENALETHVERCNYFQVIWAQHCFRLIKSRSWYMAHRFTPKWLKQCNSNITKRMNLRNSRQPWRIFIKEQHEAKMYHCKWNCLYMFHLKNKNCDNFKNITYEHYASHKNQWMHTYHSKQFST